MKLYIWDLQQNKGWAVTGTGQPWVDGGWVGPGNGYQETYSIILLYAKFIILYNNTLQRKERRKTIKK